MYAILTIQLTTATAVICLDGWRLPVFTNCYSPIDNDCFISALRLVKYQAYIVVSFEKIRKSRL